MEPTPASAAPHLGSKRWECKSGGVASGSVTRAASASPQRSRHCLARLIREALDWRNATTFQAGVGSRRGTGVATAAFCTREDTMTRSTGITTAALVLVLLCAVPSSSEGSAGLRVGLKAGWPWSWISYDGPGGQQNTDSDTRIFSGGIVLELPFGDSGALAVVSGVTYVVKSGDGDVNGGTILDEHGTPIGTLTSDWEYYCVAVPLNVKCSFATGQLSPYVAGGAEIGIPVKAERLSSLSPAGGGPTAWSVRDVKDDMRAFEFSLAGACGLEFPIGSNAGFVEVAYVHGLTDVWKDDLEEVRYRTLTLSGGVMF